MPNVAPGTIGGGVGDIIPAEMAPGIIGVGVGNGNIAIGIVTATETEIGVVVGIATMITIVTVVSPFNWKVLSAWTRGVFRQTA